MIFGETASPVFSETTLLTQECLWYNELLKFQMKVQVSDAYKDLQQV